MSYDTWRLFCCVLCHCVISFMWSQIAKFMGPTWGVNNKTQQTMKLGHNSWDVAWISELHIYAIAYSHWKVLTQKCTFFTIISNTLQQQARYLSDVICVCACFPGGRQGPQGFIITCRLGLVKSGGVNELTNVWLKRNIGPGTIDLVKQEEVHSSIKMMPSCQHR